MATMSTKERLAKKRQQEQNVRNYPPSSRWYTGLNNAISYVDLAETSTASKDKFLNAWSAIYNLYMMTHVRGQIENVTLSGWIDLIKTAPDVRRRCEQVSDDFLMKLDKAKNTLLIDAERKLWRESKQCLDIWRNKRRQDKALSAEKACIYTFLIGRDLRNAVSHPTLNPNAAATKKALSGAANLFLDLAIAAIEATIEHPPEGTTGKATAYRSFLYPFMVNSDSFFSDYYLERLMPDQELTGFDDAELKENLKHLYRENSRLSAQLSAEGAGPVLTGQQWCEPVLFPALGIEAQLGSQIVSESAVFKPSYEIAKPNTTVQSEYQGRAAGKDLACLIWVVPWRSNTLDVVPHDEAYTGEGSAFSGLTWMEIAQRSLLASDVPWAILTNGRKLRLLGKGTAHKPRAFLEMNLEEIANQRGDETGKLAFRYLLGLFSQGSFTEQDDKERTRLERMLAESDRHGKEISDELKQNVFRALEELGDGFLDYMKVNAEVVQGYETVYTLEPEPDEALLTDIYQESLSLMYRLLFLFYAESRDMLPMDYELYRESYSLESIRDEIIATRDNPDKARYYFDKRSTDLWNQLTEELFPLIQKGGLYGRIPAYNGGLFDPEKHPFLEHFAIGDYYLARAIDLLSRTQPRKDRPKGEGRKKVTYRDLDVRHLGSIYEGILEYSAHIADQEMAIMLRGSGNNRYEEYVTVPELKTKELEDFNAYKKTVEEDPDNPIVAGRSKVTGIKDAGQYFLVSGGRDSKRKSSGSYYTPDYIVQYIIDNTLGPLVRGETREENLKDKPLNPDEILSLKVLDPAMGSGHFLVAATEFLARAYGEAMIRTGQDNDSVMDEDEFTRYKRLVAERCIYGVDLNPMAVELAKLSIWLFTMDRNRPLSFLNHHLKTGNALVGAWIQNLGELPKLDGKGCPVRRDNSFSQLNIFEQRFREKVPVMLSELSCIVSQETDSVRDVQAKKARTQVIQSIKKPFKQVADVWTEYLFERKEVDYQSHLANFEGLTLPESNLSDSKKFFHWELEFPDICLDNSSERSLETGFNAIVGNPPYVDIKGLEKVEVEYLFSEYPSANNRVDLFSTFIEKGLSLSNNTNFRMSMIVPTSLMTQSSYRKLRQKVTETYRIIRLVRLPNESLGESAGEVKVDTVIFIFGNSNKNGGIVETAGYTGYERIDQIDVSTASVHHFIEQDYWNENNDFVWSINTSSQDERILSKIETNSTYLEEEVEFCLGLTPYDKHTGHTPQQIKDRVFHASMKKDDTFRELLAGNDVERYKVQWGGKEWISYGPWLGASREPRFFTEKRILVKQIIDWSSKRIWAGLTEQELYNSQNAFNLLAKSEWEIEYVLGLLNSKLMTFYHRKRFLDEFKMRFQKILVKDCKRLPIRKVDHESLREVEIYEKIVEKVKSLCSLLSQNSSVSHKKQVESLDTEIDSLVYKLYGLNSDEIEVVEKVVR